MRRLSGWAGLCLLLVTTQTFAGLFEQGTLAAKQGDYARAVKTWRPLAKRGNAKAQYNLGLLYHQGLGVRKNDRKAVRWWRRAAELGDAKAQASLGNMYQFGLGVPRNNKAAAKWYQSAARKGDETAQYNIGFMYLKGNGKPKNYHKAMYWFRRAADQGDAYARFYMGFMYEHGQGVAVNSVAAYALYNLTARRRHQGNNLAVIYRDRLAKKMTRRAIEHGGELTRQLLLAYPMTKALDAYLAKR